VRISDRFIDNGVTGGFFLAGQFILLALWGLTGWVNPLIHLNVSSTLQPTVNALLVALGIISIFFFGLLLDLLATGFSPFIDEEIISMKSHLDHNQDWLVDIEKEDSYFKNGCDNFKAAYGSPFRAKMYNRNLYIRLFHHLWMHLWMKLRHGSMQSDTAFQEEEKLIVNYYRLRYFFNSYVLLNSGLSQLDTLTDQVHWWRASRAICIATVVWAFEPLFVLLIWLAEAVFIRQWLPDLTTVVHFIISWPILFLLTFLTFSIANTAFARMCSTLFSLTRVTYVKKKSDHSSSELQNRNTQ